MRCCLRRPDQHAVVASQKRTFPTTWARIGKAFQILRAPIGRRRARDKTSRARAGLLPLPRGPSDIKVMRRESCLHSKRWQDIRELTPSCPQSSAVFSPCLHIYLSSDLAERNTVPASQVSGRVATFAYRVLSFARQPSKGRVTTHTSSYIPCDRILLLYAFVFVCGSFSSHKTREACSF